MTDPEFETALKLRLKTLCETPSGHMDVKKLVTEVHALMRYAAETARIDTTLSTQGRVHKTHFVPGLPE